MRILTAALLAGAFALPLSGAAAAYDLDPSTHYVSKNPHGGGGGKGKGHDKGHEKRHGKPDHAGDRHRGHGNDAAHDAVRHGDRHGDDHVRGVGRGAGYIPDTNRTVIVDYYGNEFAAGRCPPGLAKKNNGCLPPGQAKRLWAVGQPLPTTVIYEPLPGPLLRDLAPAPYGYEYVRVGPDVLLIDTATRIILDSFGIY